MAMERTAAVEHVGGPSRKRRSRWFTGKLLVLSRTGATLLGGAAALVVPQFQDKASATEPVKGDKIALTNYRNEPAAVQVRVDSFDGKDFWSDCYIAPAKTRIFTEKGTNIPSYEGNMNIGAYLGGCHAEPRGARPWLPEEFFKAPAEKRLPSALLKKLGTMGDKTFPILDGHVWFDIE